MADLKATPQNSALGALARGLKGARSGLNNVWLPLIGDLGHFLMGKAPEEVEEWSYGNAPMRVPEMTSVPQTKRGRQQQLADALFTGQMLSPLASAAGRTVRAVPSAVKHGALEFARASAEGASHAVPVYSKLAELVKNAPKAMGEAPSAKSWGQWLGANASKLGVRPLEMQTSGILEKLAAMGGEKVSRGGLAQMAEDALPRVGKKVLGGDAATAPQRTSYQLFEDGELVSQGTETARNRWLTRNPNADVRELVHTDEQAAARMGMSPTKFDKYTLPGGTDYRETLLTLPEKQEGFYPDFDTFFKAKYGEYSTPEHPVYSQAKQAAQRTWEARNGKVEVDDFSGDRVGMRSNNFTSSHYDEPNIAAHYRTNTRTDTEGKPLTFIEELQSDWAQKGRKEGFASEMSSDPRIPELIRLQRTAREGGERERFNQLWDDFYRDHNIPDNVPLDSVLKQGTPTAPFVTDTKDWTRLAFRNALEDALNKGHDTVAWTTGAQQANRYDLSKQIDKLQYSPVSKTLDAWKDGNIVISKEVSPRDLPDVVGKDAAERLLATEPTHGRLKDSHQISGIDLTFGGKGMKGYYDQIVPQSVKDYLRDAGVKSKIEPVEIFGEHARDSYGIPSMYPERLQQHGIKLTPEQVEHLKKKGLPFYSAAPLAAPLVSEDTPEFAQGGLVTNPRQQSLSDIISMFEEALRHAA